MGQDEKKNVLQRYIYMSIQALNKSFAFVCISQLCVWFFNVPGDISSLFFFSFCCEWKQKTFYIQSNIHSYTILLCVFVSFIIQRNFVFVDYFFWFFIPFSLSLIFIPFHFRFPAQDGSSFYRPFAQFVFDEILCIWIAIAAASGCNCGKGCKHPPQSHNKLKTTMLNKMDALSQNHFRKAKILNLFVRTCFIFCEYKSTRKTIECSRFISFREKITNLFAAGTDFLFFFSFLFALYWWWLDM